LLAALRNSQILYSKLQAPNNKSFDKLTILDQVEGRVPSAADQADIVQGLKNMILQLLEPACARRCLRLRLSRLGGFRGNRKDFQRFADHVFSGSRNEIAHFFDFRLRQNIDLE